MWGGQSLEWELIIQCIAYNCPIISTWYWLIPEQGSVRWGGYWVSNPPSGLLCLLARPPSGFYQKRAGGSELTTTPPLDILQENACNYPPLGLTWNSIDLPPFEHLPGKRSRLPPPRTYETPSTTPPSKSPRKTLQLPPPRTDETPLTTPPSKFYRKTLQLPTTPPFKRDETPSTTTPPSNFSQRTYERDISWPPSWFYHISSTECDTDSAKTTGTNSISDGHCCFEINNQN